MTDYHKRPVISARVSRESLDWAHGEADRRGQPFGDFMDGLITAERDRVAGRKPPLVAARQEATASEGQARERAGST
jgi:hypothetical protein